ncbi:hypothetical protein BHM03_00036071 [Ensete ventricosum]|nr:hypothetical protein BHM03_00036071 [Ensete ventricosum]
MTLRVAAGSHPAKGRPPLRTRRGQPLAGWPLAVALAGDRPLQVAGSPLCRGALAATGRPCRGGRSYIPVFQIRMEKMKEVKRPPL